ncbi:MAG: serine/threonine protein kinase, partial [Planctomycetes bacterium]|nr:serine/threonine protein kinase [Planctomycetota bacterium]
MQQFADYWLEAELARGGMGVVYRARHMHTGRPCALKLVLSGNRATAAQIHRFQREALAQASLNHPNILRIFDGGEFNGNLYFSMELAEGGDLSNALEWTLPRKVEAIMKVARALGFAHEQGYVHRDIKPANVLLTPEGEPKLTDFGLIKHLDSTTMLTQEGALMGTPFYMSPEQARGQGSTVGPTSDVFSLGV